ncbi:MAG: Abi family protein [Alphaproteobacteria bacterium]|nr:Abi family protein [Alphaproteobacteria bacterium]
MMYKVLMHKEILRFLSPARLEKYQLADDTPEKMFERYMWNVRLSETMMPTLGFVEIGLRNHLNFLISQFYGDRWLLAPPHQLYLRQNDMDKIRAISHEIRQEKGKEIENDDIVARMNFGFWCSFMQKQYDQILWQQPKAMSTVFPYISRQYRTRQQIGPKLLLARFARNCIAHHEPIWDLQPDIEIIHETCLDLIRGMSKSIAEKIEETDHFEEVYDEGRHLLKQKDEDHPPKIFDPTRD